MRSPHNLIPVAVALCAGAASGALVTHAAVLYGDGATQGQEVYSGPDASAQAGYGAGPLGPWFQGAAVSHAAYGIVSASTSVQAGEAMYSLNNALAEAAFSDVLRINGPSGDGFVVYTYTLTGSASGDADAHLFLRHSGDPDEELAGEVTTTASFDSQPHHVTFGQPFQTGASILVIASLGFRESGAASADFSAGAALTGLHVYDARMRPIDGWTVESDSGVSYPVPAPGAGLLFIGAAASRRRRTRSVRQSPFIVVHALSPGERGGFMSRNSALALAGLCIMAGSATAQTDSFHVTQVQIVIGGINGDASKQAIQCRARTGFQNLYANVLIRAWDATGQNPVVIADGMTTVPNANTGDTVLITTPGFDASTTPVCVPDFHMVNPIPASYLPAGRLTFEDHFNTIYWSLAWGGAAYTGSTMGSLTNSPTGQFGPPFAGPLPSASLQALAFQGSATAAAGANSTDYALTNGAAVFTNNARASFTVNGGSAPCYANCDNSTAPPVLNVNDFVCFQNHFAAGDSYANCDGSTTPPVLNVNDFICFQGQFAAGCH